MLCYECLELGKQHEAIGLCHHCSIALCEYHGRVIADPVSKTVPLVREIVLPKQARLLLCNTCLSAMKQIRECNPAQRTEIASREVTGVR